MDKMELSEFNNANQTISQMNIDPAHLYRNHQLQQQQQQQNLRFNNGQQQTKVSTNISTSKQHRELPVDVPDSFVGIAKQSPRYPPPKLHRQVSPTSQPNQYLINNPCAQQSATTSTSAQSHHHLHHHNHQQQSTAANANNPASNLIQHNSGLRSSLKLKQLEKSRNGTNSNNHNFPIGQMQPAVNQAFELNEDDSIETNTDHLINHRVANNPNAPATTNKSLKQQHQQQLDLTSIYNRLQQNIAGEFANVSGDLKLAKLLSIYNTIVQTHDKQFKIPTLQSKHATACNAQGQQEPLTYKLTDLLQSVIFLLHNEQMTNDAAELLAILGKHELEGVCSAYDRIAQSFEFAKSSATPPSSPQLGNNNDNTAMQPQPPMHSAHKAVQQHQTMVHHQTMDMDYDYAPEQIQMDIENNLYQNSGLHPLTDIDLNDGTCTKTVRIEKTTEQAFGATIKNDIDGSVVIGRIVCGGAAHKSRLLHEGDEILEVNGVQMRGKNINDVVNILEGMEGTLTFTLVARGYGNNSNHLNKAHQVQEKVFVRAFFNYDGENDKFIPCKELGLSFEKGDILTIIDRSDPRWWQAHREGDSEFRLAGLIPSINFLKQREKDPSSQIEDNVIMPTAATYYTNSKHHEKKACFVTKLFNCPKGSSPRRRKKPPLNIPMGPDEILYYEEVCLYYPDWYHKRPIILVGPKMIGQREIVAKLLQDSSRFASAVSHTSKPIQDHERDGIDFHFVSRAQFEADIKAGKFIECGQYQNQYYGTSLEAMREVVRSKKTCIHLVNTPSIFNFRHGRAGSELKPYFVFVKPDDSHPEKLRNIVSQFSQQKSNLEENIKAITAEVAIIEAHYLPYFDLVLTISDVERAYQELLFEIEKIEKEPQWIPMFWRDSPSS